MNYRILVVDDEPNIRTGIKMFLEDEQYDVVLAEHGKQAIQILQEQEVDLVLADLHMSPINGEQLLQHIITRYPSIPIIILTGHGSVEIAVEIMHKGAYDFLTKPVDFKYLLVLLKRALQTREIALRNREIQKELDKHNNRGMLTGSRAMQKIIEKVKTVAPVNSSVLITGESGVGKEVLCDRIHQLSQRKDKPLISVHCAALSESLLESELFGHDKGAFTGAISQKKGRFELADQGTIFLDEIGEINSNLQVKLLRVLQEQKFERVGGEKTIEVDVRVIAATNKNLLHEVEKGNFREDLYYRLSVINIEVPPLRDRKEDIVFLAHNFLKQFNKENNKDIEGFTKGALHILSEYQWPGNIRELKNSIESASVLAQSKYIDKDDLPYNLTSSLESQSISLAIGTSLRESERTLILATLIKYQWNKSKTAEVLGIGRKTLHNKIKEYSLDKEP